MNYDKIYRWIYKLNPVLGFSDETIEKIVDFFTAISRLKIKLSEAEENLCKSLDIDERLAVILKSHNVSQITQIPICDEFGKLDFNVHTEGICALYVMQKADSTSEIHRILYRNKLDYLKKGYNLFSFSGRYNEGNYLALSKAKTDIDVLRWRRTDGINHSIDNEQLIAKIEEWQQKYDLVLWGCGADWLHLFFVHEEPKYDGQLSSQFGNKRKKFNQQFMLWDKRTPKFNKFAVEIAEFCPDLITQVYKNKTKLIHEMKRMNGVYLWWD